MLEVEMLVDVYSKRGSDNMRFEGQEIIVADFKDEPDFREYATNHVCLRKFLPEIYRDDFYKSKIVQIISKEIV